VESRVREGAPLKRRSLLWLQWLIPVLLALGLLFRFTNLGYKVYWHDEVYTAIRATGFTRQAIDQEVFRNQVIRPEDLRKFQQIKPGSTVSDTIRSLASEDPQHPPLYFLMVRGWMHLFGSSATAIRSLPALLSLLALPFMYSLAMELFASPLVAILATSLIALSPFDVLFAQTSRQYSLLTVLTIASSWLLLRSLRLSDWLSWIGYAIAITLGLYTHPFFGLNLIAQGVYVVLRRERSPRKSVWGKRKRSWIESPLLRYGGAFATAILLYTPWLIVLFNNVNQATGTTDWTRVSTSFLYLLKLWVLSFTALFVDLDFGFNNPVTYLLRLPIVFIILISFYVVCQRTRRPTWLFLAISVIVPFLILALPDLILGGKRSAVSRYLIACFPAIQLAIAYALTIWLKEWKRLGQGILALLVIGSIVSCTVSLFSNTWWNRDLSYFNAATAERLNALSAPILITDIGNEMTNTGDLISISDRLKPNVRLLLFGNPPDLRPLIGNLAQTDLITFNPSGQLREALLQSGWQFEPFFNEGKLERLTRG
jgi:uncharacterized membrane protein